MTDDILKEATELIRIHGAEAALLAAQAADARLADGRMDEFHHWMAVFSAIKNRLGDASPSAI